MLVFLVQLILTALILMFIGGVVKGFKVDDFGSAMLAGLVLGLVNALIKPILVFLTFPITLITLGLFLLIVNAITLWLSAKVSPGFKITGFAPACWGALILCVANLFIMNVFGVAVFI